MTGGPVRQSLASLTSSRASGEGPSVVRFAGARSSVRHIQDHFSDRPSPFPPSPFPLLPGSCFSFRCGGLKEGAYSSASPAVVNRLLDRTL
jgi:hypothetical protein